MWFFCTIWAILQRSAVIGLERISGDSHGAWSLGSFSSGDTQGSLTVSITWASAQWNSKEKSQTRRVFFFFCTRVSCLWSREFSGCCWRRIRSSNRGIMRWWLQDILGCSAVMFLCSSSFYNTEYTETQGVNWNFKNSITSELSHSCGFRSAALLMTPRRARPRSLGACMLCVFPVWDVVFLRFAAVEQINSGCGLQRCDQGDRQPTFCFTRCIFSNLTAGYSQSRRLVLGRTLLKCVALQRSVAHKDGRPNIYIYKDPGLKTKEPQVLLQGFIINSQKWNCNSITYQIFLGLILTPIVLILQRV